ncbi:MAG: HD domain-containing protein [Ruminococcus sp.]|nr:HD domain-containing protein [Ruminococcus sp.]
MNTTTQLLNSLYNSMISYYAGDPGRIQHFIKVHSFARLIAQGENLSDEQLLILEAAAYVHDIGIKPAELKHGECSGPLQEKYGPPEAEKMLRACGFSETVIERVSYLVGHHHTYTNIDGLDYQILVEADFLVNLYEGNSDKEAIEHTYQQIFCTRTGKNICRTMFGGF